uniref:Uncharacterized protein n=1 Tax=Hemiselmis tepida TaxID=464990 RepID=A0A7S0VM77_9CRYP|mmetsp:Transcript_21495/g.54182  ORF Transcript_21495/g.54182 Transcript_21495/m.54182 type:complete len:478 (+) Transcript_21495:69-1502(+)
MPQQEDVAALRDANDKLKQELLSAKEAMAEKQRLETEAKHEAQLLRSELDLVYQKLDRARHMKEMCKKGAGRAPIDGKGGSSDGEHPGTLGDRIGRTRQLSDLVMADAEKHLETTMEGLQTEAKTVSHRGVLGIIALVLLAAATAPFALVYLRDSGMVEIKRGTVLHLAVNEYDAMVRQALHSAALLAKQLITVCAVQQLAPQRCEAGTVGGEVPYYFNARKPPLLRQGHLMVVNTTERVEVGQASLRVCARGTSEQSFLRRDDCDGCLCAPGSVWLHYKDPRFFGKEGCIPEQQWRDCIYKWAFGMHKPNFCWEFIWNGGRRDPQETEHTKLVVDSCSLHHGCFVMLKRLRRWVLIEDFWAARDTVKAVHKRVGVDPAQIAAVNATVNIRHNSRTWGFPASVQTLLKIKETNSPLDWQPIADYSDERPFKGGKQHRVWQLESRYELVATDKSGEETTMVEWDQKEYQLYVDSSAEI